MLNVKSGIKAGIVGVSMLVLVGCAANYRNHGYTPTEEELAAITVGVDTRATVSESVGSPSSSGILNDSGYYYVRSRVRHFAYQAPQVVERELVAISFDGRGVVTNIERFGLEDGQAVPLTRRVTESGVRDNTFLRQLLNNFGRFAPGAIAGDV